MELSAATTAFAALAQPSRLSILRRLVAAGPEGLPAGDLATALEMKANTLSANLTQLRTAGLVHNRREGRSVRYFADLGGLGALISYLVDDCCNGDPAACGPALRRMEAATCCP